MDYLQLEKKCDIITLLMWFYFLTILNGYKHKQRDERWDYSSEVSRPSQSEGSKQEQYFSYIIFYKWTYLQSLFYIYTVTLLSIWKRAKREQI